MNLSRALRLDSHPPFENPQSGECIAFVGAGGKTTAMFQLARELIELSSTILCPQSVVVTATSHLGIWQIPLSDHQIVAESPEGFGELPEGVILVTGVIEGDRTQPGNPGVLFWLHEFTKSKRIPLLIEADGSRGRPLKAPAAHEPPVPNFVDTAIVVAGLGGLGKLISDENVFRSERFLEISESAIRRGGDSESRRQFGESANQRIVTAEMLVRVLIHPEGGLKNIPVHSRRIALLNQAETPELHSTGGRMARDLLEHFDAVLVGSLQQNCFQTFERTAGIVLAAGESTRFGQPKQLLDWKGKPFVRHVAETALHARLWPVVVVTGFRAAEVESALHDLPVEIVRNEDWRSGQGLSIAAGVRSLPKNIGAGIFLLADQPQIGADVIQALTESHAQSLPAILAPLVLEEKRANPVLFDRVTFPDLLALTGDVGGRAIFDKHKVEYLPWHDDALLLDVDTPEDYERLKNL